VAHLPRRVVGNAPTPVMLLTVQGASVTGLAGALWQHSRAFRRGLVCFSVCFSSVTGCALLSVEGGTGAGATAAPGVPWAEGVTAQLAAAGGGEGGELQLAASVAVQYAAWCMLQEGGVPVAAVSGASAGELVAALAGGQIGSLEQLCELVRAQCCMLAQMPAVYAAPVEGSAEGVQHDITRCGFEGLVSIVAVEGGGGGVWVASSFASAVEHLAASAGLQARGPVRQLRTVHLPATNSLLAGCLADVVGSDSFARADGALGRQGGVPRFVPAAASTPPACGGSDSVWATHWLCRLHLPVRFDAAAQQLHKYASTIIHIGGAVFCSEVRAWWLRAAASQGLTWRKLRVLLCAARRLPAPLRSPWHDAPAGIGPRLGGRAPPVRPRQPVGCAAGSYPAAGQPGPRTSWCSAAGASAGCVML